MGIKDFLNQFDLFLILNRNAESTGCALNLRKTSGSGDLSSGGPSKSAETPEVLRRYEITVEREFISLRSGPVQAYTAFCDACGHDVTMLPPEQVAEVAGIAVRAVYRWVEEKRVHFIESDSGRLFLCSDSFQALLRSNPLSPGESR
jgi:hypothetical protein